MYLFFLLKDIDKYAWIASAPVRQHPAPTAPDLVDTIESKKASDIVSAKILIDKELKKSENKNKDELNSNYKNDNDMTDKNQINNENEIKNENQIKNQIEKGNKNDENSAQQTLENQNNNQNPNFINNENGQYFEYISTGLSTSTIKINESGNRLSEPQALQLVIGKTMREELGEEVAVSFCKNLKCGQLVLVTGRLGVCVVCVYIMN